MQGQNGGGGDRTHAEEEDRGGAEWCGRHVRAHGCGLCTCKAHGRAVVEEVRGTTEDKRIVSGLVPEEF